MKLPLRGGMAACVFYGTCSFISAQNFIIEGHIPGLNDGVEVLLMGKEDNRLGTIAETVAKGGVFKLEGHVPGPQYCTLATNNLKLVEKNNWPQDSICWTYNDLFVENLPMTVQAGCYADMRQSFSWTPSFCIEGGKIQSDFNDYNKMLYQCSEGNSERVKLIDNEVQWKFITRHPNSVVTAFFANNLLKRGYNLTSEQISRLEQSLTALPEDTARFAKFISTISYARQTAKGAPFIDLELTDTKGDTCTLSSVLPKNRYVLVDFWASWCGICLASMPAIQELLNRYQDADFAVVGISCDEKELAWRTALGRHKVSWPQYLLTDEGRDGLFRRYQVGNGVPYYILIAPDGKVLESPEYPESVRDLLENHLKDKSEK